MGEIGRIVARRAEGLDMTVCYHEPEKMPDVSYRYFDDVVELARHVDFLSLHCRPNPRPAILVDRAVLKALGPQGILVNMARGVVVDEEALIEALESGGIAGAGLDVFENEPHVPERLRALTNVVLSPHQGAFTEEAKAEMLEMALANLRAPFRRPAPDLASAMKPDILLVEDISTALPILELLESHYTVHVLPEESEVPAAVAERIRALVTTTNKGADGALIGALPNLEMIANAGAHLDRIDLGGRRRRAIPVTYTPGISVAEVADLAFALLLSAARLTCEGDRYVRAGRWHDGALRFGIRVNRKRLGIVGLGRIGRMVAKRAGGFAWRSTITISTR